MKLSVIIPAYNEERRLESCLQSIIAQVEKPDEIIVVDNNSHDKTAEVAKRMGARVVKETVQGMIPARNRGFDEAKGDIIARTDADTHVPSDWLKRIKKAFRDDPKLIGLSGPAAFYDIPQFSDISDWPTKVFFETLHKAFRHDFLFGPNMAIRKKAWEKVKDDVCLDDKEVHEDIDLSLHLIAYGRIKFDPELVVSSSARRWRKISPYFEYPYRGIKTYRKHKRFLAGAKRRGRRIVSNVLNRRKEFLDHLLHLPDHL